MVDGALITHQAFGTGRVVHVGEYEGDDAVWVDFDRGDRKMLNPEYAGPHVRTRVDGEAATPQDAAIRCDVCGVRPVVVTIASPSGRQQYCEAHMPDHRP
jgi:hypothetical protein